MMKKLIFCLLACNTCILQQSIAMQNHENSQHNNINMRALLDTQKANIIESNLDNNNLILNEDLLHENSQDININMQALLDTQKANIIESNLDNNNLILNEDLLEINTTYNIQQQTMDINEDRENLDDKLIKTDQTIDLDDFLNKLSKNEKFLMIRDINNKILTEEKHITLSKFRITNSTLSKYKKYWNKLKSCVNNIKKEVNKSDKLEVNNMIMSGNLSLSVSDIVNKIENDSTIIKDDVKFYLKHKRKRSITEIINSENDLKGKNILSEIYILSQIISGVIMKWQTYYIDAFMENNNSHDMLIVCKKQLDKIFEIFNITDE